ncbi:MAG: membrane protein insertase YidC [Clostridia bacterium]|nr:membrane protein insertase YidC [Clostridia bacterium]
MNDIFGFVLEFCYKIADNYVVSLLLFALLMQIVIMLPLGIWQHRNMIKQAKMRPKEYALRQKYAGRNDQVTMRKYQQELQEMYTREGYSPLAGCLPMIIQIILIFPIYQVVIRPLEFIAGLSSEVCAKLGELLTVNGSAPQIEIASQLRDNWGNLSAIIDPKATVKIGEETVNLLAKVQEAKVIPDATLFGTDLSYTPFSAFGQSYWWLIFIPILNLAFMYLSQYLSRKLTYQPNQEAQAQMGGSMKIMMWTMPLMTMFFTFGFASAIGIYWIFRTVLAMLQQFILAKSMPYPRYTEEQLKEMTKTSKKSKTTQQE